MHSSIRPKQIPLLKKDVCDDKRFPRFSAAVGSVGSRASRGKAVTLRSVSQMQVGNCPMFVRPRRTSKNDEQLEFLQHVYLGNIGYGNHLGRSAQALISKVAEEHAFIRPVYHSSTSVCLTGQSPADEERSWRTVWRCTVHFVQSDEESVKDIVSNMRLLFLRFCCCSSICSSQFCLAANDAAQRVR